MSKGLSKLQMRIVDEIANVTVNTYEPDDPTEARYQDVFHAVADYWWRGIPALAGEPRFNSAKVSFSRAVASLIRRGIVEGIALAWCNVPHGEMMRWQGGENPRLKMLGLTEIGWKVVEDAKSPR
jgi:hypothetical protein